MKYYKEYSVFYLRPNYTKIVKPQSNHKKQAITIATAVWKRTDQSIGWSLSHWAIMIYEH